MSKYAYVVGACSKYVPELCALLNSLDYVGNTQDFHLIGIDMPEDFTEQFDLLGFKVIHHVISKEEIEAAHGISEITCRKRYWYAATIGQDYSAVCILDADLIFNRDPIQFFNIAEKTGYILGPCKEQNKVYDDEHQEVDGKWIIERGFYNDKDLCNSPVFIDARVWKDPLMKSWDIFLNHGYKAPDMDAMNMCFLEAGAYDKIIKLAGLQWLGTNEQMLKPYIRAVERHGKLFNECGPEIFCYHGHYAHKRWRECQLDNRHNCAEGYLKASGNSDNMARGAMDLLYGNFKKMLFGTIKLRPSNYRHPELDIKEDYGELWG